MLYVDSTHPVALVVDRDFGDRARDLALRMHVWLIDSAANRAAAEPIWEALKRSAPKDPLAQGITIFQSPAQLSPEGAVAEVLDTLLEHHFGAAVLEIYGVRDPHALEKALGGSGFIASGSEAGRIVCTRKTPP
jgi:hypothetical protein